jgi:hypothetical protein
MCSKVLYCCTMVGSKVRFVSQIEYSGVEKRRGEEGDSRSKNITLIVVNTKPPFTTSLDLDFTYYDINHSLRVRCSNQLATLIHTRLDLIYSRLDIIHNSTTVDLIHTRLNLIHISARSHPRSARSHPHSAKS